MRHHFILEKLLPSGKISTPKEKNQNLIKQTIKYFKGSILLTEFFLLFVRRKTGVHSDDEIRGYRQNGEPRLLLRKLFLPLNVQTSCTIILSDIIW